MDFENEWQEEGFNASEDGKPVSACAYPADSSAARWWLSGWDLANTDQ